MSITVLEHENKQILISPLPYKLRANCKQGIFSVGDANTLQQAQANGRGSWVEMVIVETKSFHGDLGKTEDVDWGQVWFLPVAADDKRVHPGLLMTMMIKGISLELFTKAIVDLEIEALGGGKDPIESLQQVFRATFAPRQGQYGDYFALEWSTRKPKKDEQAYLSAASLIHGTMPEVLVDHDTTRGMVPKVLGSDVPALSAAQ